MEKTKNRSLSRRKFLTTSFVIVMLFGVLASIGQFFFIVLQFLYPKKKKEYWFFVTTIKKMSLGKSMEYVTPEGQSIVISRIGSTGHVKDFMALSNVCPHLGCKVYWEGNTKSFFCPCHNGRFDFVGQPLEGPPAKANQQLIKFPLKIEKGLLYIQLSSESLVRLSQLNQKHEDCRIRKGLSV